MVKNGFNFKFYIDGVLVRSVTSSIGKTNDTPDEFWLGWNYYSPADKFVGQIDDFRIYTYALSDAEVANVAKR